MDSYRVIEEKLKRLEPFRGNTLRAEYDDRGNYRVFSYATEIATYWVLAEGKTLDPRQISVTTSKHQTLIARAWGFPPVRQLRKTTPNKFVGAVVQ